MAPNQSLILELWDGSNKLINENIETGTLVKTLEFRPFKLDRDVSSGYIIRMKNTAVANTVITDVMIKLGWIPYYN